MLKSWFIQNFKPILDLGELKLDMSELRTQEPTEWVVLQKISGQHDGRAVPLVVGLSTTVTLKR